MEKLVEERVRQVYSILLSKPTLRPYIDTKHKIPEVYCGTGQIKLIIIGQDPTVKNKASRKNITTVLSLDKPGKLQRYIFKICSYLNIDPVNEVYATNLLKNFFEEPLTDDKKVISKFAHHWVPVLKEELEPYRKVPVMTVGDTVLNLLFCSEHKNLVRNYWGYHEDWKNGLTLPFEHCDPSSNILGRDLFPFPNQPSIVKDFYASRIEKYTEYMKEKLMQPEVSFV